MGALVVLAALPGCGWNVPDEGGQPPGEQGTFDDASSTFITVADAHVDASKPARNFGATDQLFVDWTPTEYRTFLRFNVKKLRGRVTRATLRLYVLNGTSEGPAVHEVDSDWNEDVVTFDQQPAKKGAALSSGGALRAGHWAELDVTRAVRGNGVLHFGLYAAGTDGVDFVAREDMDSTLRPRLVVETRGSVQAPSDETP